MDVSTSEQLHIFSRLLIAGGLGAVIGLEREIRGYPAGIRTIGLVALGASLFTDVSQLFSDASTSRVASNIVVGIGFIGAGVILQDRGRIHGITSAATIWAAAAIGMAIGLSLYVVGVLGAVLIVVALEARPLTRRLDRVLYRWLGELSEKEADEELGVAWRRTREEWEKEQGE
jgi:putative Mg2+ transporter-C (MgtC) family protein